MTPEGYAKHLASQRVLNATLVQKGAAELVRVLNRIPKREREEEGSGEEVLDEEHLTLWEYPPGTSWPPVKVRRREEGAAPITPLSLYGGLGRRTPAVVTEKTDMLRCVLQELIDGALDVPFSVHELVKRPAMETYLSAQTRPPWPHPPRTLRRHQEHWFARETETTGSYSRPTDLLKGHGDVLHRRRAECNLAKEVCGLLRDLEGHGALRTSPFSLGNDETLLITKVTTHKLVHLLLSMDDNPSHILQQVQRIVKRVEETRPRAPAIPAIKQALREKGAITPTAALTAEVEAVQETQPPAGFLHRRFTEKTYRVLKTLCYTKKLQHQTFQGSGTVPFMPFCPHGTPDDCRKAMGKICPRVHLHKMVVANTNVRLGDCPYLDACRRGANCEHVHYKLLPPGHIDLRLHKKLYTKWMIQQRDAKGKPVPFDVGMTWKSAVPAQWIKCDIRTFDMRVLGKFEVIMADPPWDIHMELPYGTVSDEEMRRMDLQSLQDNGLIFLWVTGRAMELGRDCLRNWGYTLKEEVVWIKINQTQRLIRMGRTGHWINHSKEHCLVGIKGNPELLTGLDCDVISTEVRETSRKPDEIYGMIERMCPDGRKLELFGRNHNLRDGWLTLGNQLSGVRIVEPQLLEAYNRYVEKEVTKMGTVEK
eukprot:Sspe_Gene.23952::Locus_9389_Transcript_1_2_Confidence_0.889_Length_2016::g.23952::m.23952/K05925/METTL3_14; mRNA (2'-O-methyladenosine-N6-)-methyltransferase